MFHAPHTLYVERRSYTQGEGGHMVDNGLSMEYVTNCRCDEETSSETATENAISVKTSFRITAPICDLKGGDVVFVPEKDCRGVVKSVKRTGVGYLHAWI